MQDVIVVGAGPAGLLAGRRLAQRGAAVTILEEHAAVGAPVHCTGILARETFDEFDLSRGSILNELRTAVFVPPVGEPVVYRPPNPEAVVVDRGAFDRELADQARTAGAGLTAGVRVTAIVPRPDRVTIETSGGRPLVARACVLACGGRYGLHRALDLGLPPRWLQTAQQEIPVTRPGEVELHFGQAVAPKGFAWAVPVVRAGRPAVRVGVMTDRQAAACFREMVRRVGERWGIEGGTRLAPRRKILPLAPIRQTYADRLLVAGDAAGLVKPTTGGGIYYSLVSGALAADVLAEALASDVLGAAALSEYQRRWRARLAPELSAQLQLRDLAERMADPDIDQLFELARTDGVMPIVRRTASFNRHRKLIFALLHHPPARQLFYRSLVS